MLSKMCRKKNSKLVKQSTVSIWSLYLPLACNHYVGTPYWHWLTHRWLSPVFSAVIISQGASTVLFAIHPIFFDKFNNACLKYFKHTLNMLSLAVTQPLTFMSFGCVPIIPQKEKSFQFEIQTQNQMNCFFNSPNELKAPHREQFIFDRVESIGVSKVVQLNF